MLLNGMHLRFLFQKSDSKYIFKPKQEASYVHQLIDSAKVPHGSMVISNKALKMNNLNKQKK